MCDTIRSLTKPLRRLVIRIKIRRIEIIRIVAYSWIPVTLFVIISIVISILIPISVRGVSVESKLWEVSWLERVYVVRWRVAWWWRLQRCFVSINIWKNITDSCEYICLKEYYSPMDVYILKNNKKYTIYSL